MSRAHHVVFAAASVALAAWVIAACNDLGTCPAAAAVTPDAACSNEQLQCEYDLATPSPSCNGTTTVIPSSCTCTGGAWACPAPIVCDEGTDAPTPDAATDAPASETGQADARAGSS